MTEEKPAIIRAVLVVKKKEYITPHYIRVTLTGDDVPAFRDATVGSNNKIFIPPPGIREVHMPVPDPVTGQLFAPEPHLRPAIRTYTHRSIDIDRNEMVIDFVAHGDNGPASAWVNRAQEGDPLGVAMKVKAAPLFPKADWYLLAGDATGLPVLGAILERLPPCATGIAYIEVPGKADEQVLKTEAEIEIRWLHHPAPGENTLLADAVCSTVVPNGDTNTRFAYVAAEYTSVKTIRRFLRKEQGLQKEELYAFSYWKHGVSEEGSAGDRRQERQE
ncbi:siderophore-interacting protein [Hufsiella ginkgonis]|uniref:SIP domain-containing protein n=1 Tax=Hufsiella ginkgonis TaxID=2695274 RepID=A0A7K1XT08_9SPHI|nr:siderophore-interacting protein [Hufsiella ginkgonis]MXV14082.1 SIP domain-containing protein [Hufsiella ginkgonis]